VKGFWSVVWILVAVLIVGEAAYAMTHPRELASLLAHLGIGPATGEPPRTQASQTPANQMPTQVLNANCAPNTVLRPGDVFKGPSPAKPLYDAVWKGNAEGVQAALRSIPRPPGPEQAATLLLAQAVTSRNARIVQALLEGGADATYRGCGDIAMNVLAAAAPASRSLPSVPVAELLLAHGAPLRNAEESVSPPNRNDPLVTAAIFGDVELVTWLKAHGARLDDRDFRSATPLHAVLMEFNDLPAADKVRIVKLLLDLGADPSATLPRRGSALHLAIEAAEPQVVELLLARHADATAKDARGRTPLEYARYLLAHPLDPTTPLSNRRQIVALLGGSSV
jgi:hypothetical protein